jgi:hypothetical protein
MASINNVSTRSQMRTNIPGDIRISGRVTGADAATPNLAGKGFTFLYSGTTGIYYVLLGTGVTATFQGALDPSPGALVSVTGASAVTNIYSWNLETLLANPVTGPRHLYAVPAAVNILSQPVGLQIKVINPTTSALAAFANTALDGFTFEITCATTSVTV